MRYIYLVAAASAGCDSEAPLPIADVHIELTGPTTVQEGQQATLSARLEGEPFEPVVVAIHTTAPEETGIDIYIGIGGAPEGVLAAAALRCTGGQMQGRLILDTPEKVERARRMGIEDPKRLYDMHDMAKGDVVFSATGVTDGNMLAGVKFMRGYIETHTIVMRAHSLTIREIKAKHRDMDKF